MNNQQIVFPEINREEMEKGVLPKEQTIAFVEKAIDSLILIGMLKVTGFPSRKNEDKAREVEKTLEDLTNKYPQIIWVRQNILGRKIQDMIQEPGNSSTLFTRFRILLGEAVFHGALVEWKEEELNKTPFGLRKECLVRLYDPKDGKTRFFLPPGWKNETQKNIARLLISLNTRARNTYRAEHGKPPLEEKKAEKPTETKTEQNPPPPKSKPPKISRKGKEDDAEARKQAKAIKAKARKKEEADQAAVEEAESSESQDSPQTATVALDLENQKGLHRVPLATKLNLTPLIKS